MGGADALKYGRLSHVDQTYLRLATYRAANAALIEHQASVGLSQSWGGDLVRLGGRDAVRRPGAVGVSAAEPEVLRAPGWRDLAEHDQHAGGAPGGKAEAGTPRGSL
ncbi:Tn3 family transposase [Streptomyces sp. NPDC048342]|uniref:Tn3 family transposase n=1 Tax=unclassified Streptomyces TaxID=2593676 RepID=UPI00342D3268